MEKNRKLLKLAIELEYTMAKLYKLYSTLFKEDEKFWLEMVEEENHHAHMIEVWLEVEKYNILPAVLLSNSQESLEIAKEKINDIIEQFKKEPPSMREAYNKAFDLELEAGELHYQLVMNLDTEDEFIKTFQELNKEDMNHSKKINEFIKQKLL